MRRVPAALLIPASRGAAQEGAISTRVAIPLSLFFAGLIANCGQWDIGGNCASTWHRIDKDLVATEAEFQYFAHEDGALDQPECFQLCSCLAQGYRPIIFPKHDAATMPDADADEGGTEGGRGTGGSGGGPGDANLGPCGAGHTRMPDDARVDQCEYNGMATEGHAVHCKVWRFVDPGCGRDGACHASLGRGFGPSAVARWLAFAAATEAASIRSFVTLRRELRALGAPADLVSRAHRAAREEAKHTRWMHRLARARGGTVEWPRSVRLPPRDLEAVATENAVEGCVHETWAALLNHHQAAYATDLEVRTVLARIATDEAAHAELAFDIDRWAMGALPRAARARVQRSKQAAARALRKTVRESAPSLRAVLGLPVQSALQFFARELENRLWS